MEGRRRQRVGNEGGMSNWEEAKAGGWKSGVDLEEKAKQGVQTGNVVQQALFAEMLVNPALRELMEDSVDAGTPIPWEHPVMEAALEKIMDDIDEDVYKDYYKGRLEKAKARREAAKAAEEEANKNEPDTDSD